MKNIDRYDRLYGEKNNRPGSEYIFSELLETRSRSFGWNIEPHVHPRLYQLFYIAKGDFTFIQNKDQKQMKGPCLLLIPPTVLHGFVYDPDATGRILSLSDTIVDALFADNDFLSPMTGNLQIFQEFSGTVTHHHINTLIEAIDAELFNHWPQKQVMVQIGLQQLFVCLYRLWKSHEVNVVEPDHSSLTYFRKFQKRIHQTGNTPTIAALAQELGITAVHLNRICRQIAGKPASLLLQEHMIGEAKKYLTHTTYDISEIAYLLNFDYPNYFARFFKKHTGLTPKQFREGSGETDEIR